eukprot:gene3984-4534_t
MIRYQAILTVCKQRYTVVRYDLAVAKVGRKIHSEESPFFDDMFIMFGSFHIELSFFSSLGKMIEGSGGPYVLTESGILAEGSLNMLRDVSIKDDTLAALSDWVTKEESDVRLQLNQLSTAYKQYCEETLSGRQGKTAQYALDLLNIDEIHPSLSEVLEDGAFSVGRGNQDFS